MKIWGVLALVKPKDLWSLTKLLLRFPMFAIPTIKATAKCIRICNRLFGNEHHNNNATNAFRHALWNFLIIIESKGWTTKEDKALLWSKLITDWHEEFSPNKDLARAMDLHNNQVGRNLFIENTTINTEEGINQLKAMIQNSAKVNTEEELLKYTNRLVHLKD